jgi:hypothetical protein
MTGVSGCDWAGEAAVSTAKEFGERTHSSAAVRITVGFIVIDSLEFSFLGMQPRAA